ncbi:hypothetical protein G3A39_39565 [Paraburkholderia aspalathi]|nr:hypothetical protein [Paraburkholderia aspalathi]
MAIIDFAKRELEMLRGPNPAPDKMQDQIETAILDIVDKFAGQGHSGSSASYTIACIEKLLRFEPLTPLTGVDDEWANVSDGLYQNKRCSRVFKDANGQVYDINGKVFREPSGACFTNRDSRVPVVFPYTPKTEIVDVAA